MRYIGSKVKLLNELSSVVHDRSKKHNSFCDMFAGTGAVGQHFKKNFTITSNDSLYFSYVLQKATIEINEIPDFKILKKEIKQNPFEYFRELDITKFKFDSSPFFYENYSPSAGCQRQYFTTENGLRIDAVRQLIETWKNDELLSEGEYFYLLASLINAIPSVSNIAGTYGAYLKHWDSRALKKLNLVEIPINGSNQKNSCFNENANDLIEKIKGDILYLDPPYNERQYFSNYHILDTAARYDYPPIKGVTGTRADIIRNHNSLSSDYCKKDKVAISLSNLIEAANFKLIILSYSTHGIISEEEIVSILERYGNKSTLHIKRVPYRQYKRVSKVSEKELNELIFSIEK